jgi:TRAP-type C4-dicarboxylate transport system permease small subunit
MLKTILDRTENALNRLLVVGGGLTLLGMVALTCANILARELGTPIPGTFELMGYLGAVTTAFALGYTQKFRGHIAVNVLITRFPPKIQQTLNSFNNLVCALFFAAVARQLWLKAAGFRHTGEVSETLRIIFYPFTYAVAAGCLLMALVFAFDLLRDLLRIWGGTQ